LGILKAGGAYVPLDPTYPQERLAFMLNDTQAPVLLTQQRLLAGIPEPKAEVICLDVDWQIVSQESKQNPVYEVTSQNLIYVIYTSGSTGQPKGVALPHRALMNLVAWQLDYSTLAIGTKTLQFPSLSFDVSAQEIFVTLCSGGILVLVTEAIRQDRIRLARFVIDHAIERLFVPDIALQQLIEAIATQKQLPMSLKEVIQCGEQLQLTPAVIKLFSQLKTCVLHNHYGPAESHVVTAFVLDERIAVDHQQVRLADVQILLHVDLIGVRHGGLGVVTGGGVDLLVGIPARGAAVLRGYRWRPDPAVRRFSPSAARARDLSCSVGLGGRVRQPRDDRR